VAIQVRSEHDLPTLRVRLQRTTREQAQAVFDVLLGAGEPRRAGHATTRQLGVPDQVTSWRDLPETRFTVPARIARQISEAIRELVGADNPPALWLELAHPRGYLHLVPWEQLLSEPLGLPLMRLPNFTLRPQAPGASLRVVLCASHPAAKSAFPVEQLIATIAAQWSGAVDRRVSVHVFTDIDVTDHVRALLASRPNVTVHNPRDAASYPPPPRTRNLSETEGEVSNPWLRWIVDALEGKAADAVHFIGHGYISGDRGALALASTPVLNTDTRWSRFVGATQLGDFLCQVGAWSLALSGPPHNHCAAGLRDLADSIAQLRPGVVLLHDAGADYRGDELRRALTMIYGGTPPSGPMPAMTCWSHPAFVAFEESTRSALITEDGHSTLISSTTQEVLARAETPAWVAAGARALETLQADWTSGTTGPPDPDAVAALRSVSELFDEHVRTYAPDADGHNARG
jgi:hypothetical protein